MDSFTDLDLWHLITDDLDLQAHLNGPVIGLKRGLDGEGVELYAMNTNRSYSLSVMEDSTIDSVKLNITNEIGPHGDFVWSPCEDFTEGNTSLVKDFESPRMVKAWLKGVIAGLSIDEYSNAVMNKLAKDAIGKISILLTSAGDDNPIKISKLMIDRSQDSNGNLYITYGASIDGQGAWLSPTYCLGGNTGNYSPELSYFTLEVLDEPEGEVEEEYQAHSLTELCEYMVGSIYRWLSIVMMDDKRIPNALFRKTESPDPGYKSVEAKMLKSKLDKQLAS